MKKNHNKIDDAIQKYEKEFNVTLPTRDEENN